MRQIIVAVSSYFLEYLLKEFVEIGPEFDNYGACMRSVLAGLLRNIS